MATNPRAQILRELLSEFVEERVRQIPNEAFSIADVTQALSAMLTDAGQAGAFAPSDNTWMAAALDRHPFVLRSRAGSTPQWKPGLNRGALAGATVHR
jgi:hypothetical protein